MSNVNNLISKLSKPICLTGVCLSMFPLSGLAAQKPNIIFLLADDLRFNSLGCMGNPIVQTPNINELARKGVTFNNAFVTSPICCISRASIFSGQYANRHGINNFTTDFTSEARSNNYPEVLRRSGYYTGFIGKYGVGTHMPEGDFDYWKGFPGQGKYYHQGADGKFIHLTDLIGNEALEFLETRDKSKPFCLQVSFKAPHVEDGNNLHNGYVYNPFYDEYYKDETIPENATGDDKYYLAYPETFRVNPQGKTNEARVRWGLRFSTKEKYQESVKSYYRLITGMDDNIKRIVDELKKKGLEKNTVIIFSSDNGYALADHGLEGKWFGNNESLRVPLIIYDGRHHQNKHSNEDIVLNVDLAPTILDYAGVKAPDVMQGKSIKPLMVNENIEWRKEFYFDHLIETEGGRIYLPKSEGLVGLNYKYVRYFNGGDPDNFFFEELFSTKTDPLEINNLANNPDMAKIKEDMIFRLKKLRTLLK
ncbi:MAG: sulfatase [Bacteroidetes bacterium]|nr:sulfatase [Bacteroidota bacterium]